MNFYRFLNLLLLIFFVSCGASSKVNTKSDSNKNNLKKNDIIIESLESIMVGLESGKEMSFVILGSNSKYITELEVIYSEKKIKTKIDFSFDAPLVFYVLNSDDKILCDLKSKAFLKDGGVSFICTLKEKDVYTLAKSKQPIKTEFVSIRNKRKQSDFGFIETKEIIKFKKFLKTINPDYPI